MQTGLSVRQVVSKHSITLAIFALGVLCGALSFMLVPRAQADVVPPDLGNQIVCYVYNQLNQVGSPIPVLNADGCAATSTPQTGALKVITVVSGGAAAPSDFSVHVKNPANDIFGSPQPGSGVGTAYSNLTPGAYVVSEDAHSGYTASFSGSCPAGVVSIGANSTVTCTVTNTFGGSGGGTSTTSENTLALCSDAIDNDGDGLIDLADPDCAAFKPQLTVTVTISGGSLSASDFPLFLDGAGIISGTATTTTTGSHIVTQTGTSTYTGAFGGDCDSSGHVTLAIGDNKSCTLTNSFIDTTTGGGGGSTTQCNDGVDNDGDNLVDSADPGCHTDFNASNAASYDPARNDESAAAPSNGGGGDTGGGNTNTGGGTGSGSNAVVVPPGNGGGNGPISTLVPQNGLVLGTSTESCGPLLTTYMRMSSKNDAAEVAKLQKFLNDFMGAKLPVTGFFGPLTDATVRKFQVAYSADVLAPWVSHGLPNANTSTGYVYKTTQRKINLLFCTSLNIPFPDLP